MQWQALQIEVEKAIQNQSKIRVFSLRGVDLVQQESILHTSI